MRVRACVDMERGRKRKMSGAKFCPLQQETVSCTSKCSWYDELSRCCEVSMIAENLNEIAAELDVLGASIHKQVAAP